MQVCSALCGATGSLQCARCKSVYCSKSCQEDHWKQHKKSCARLNAIRLGQELFSRTVPPPVASDATCVICLCGNEEGALRQRGCACRGEVGLVHLACLESEAEQTDNAKMAWEFCSICKQSFSRETSLWLTLRQQQKSLTPGEQLFADEDLAHELGAECMFAEAIQLLKLAQRDAKHLKFLSFSRRLATAQVKILIASGSTLKAEKLCRDLIQHNIPLSDDIDGPELLEKGIQRELKLSLARILVDKGQHAEAEELFCQIAQSRPAGPDRESVIVELADAMSLQGKFSEAEELANEAYRIMLRHEGVGGRFTSAAASALGRALLGAGSEQNYSKYEQFMCEHIRVLSDHLGPEHASVLAERSDFAGFVCDKRGKPREAEAMLRTVFWAMKRALDPQHPHLMTCAGSICVTLKKQGKRNEAEQFAKEFADWLEGAPVCCQDSHKHCKWQHLCDAVKAKQEKIRELCDLEENYSQIEELMPSVDFNRFTSNEQEHMRERMVQIKQQIQALAKKSHGKANVLVMCLKPNLNCAINSTINIA